MAEVELKNLNEYKVVFVENIGLYGHVGPLFDKLFAWLGKKGLKVAGPSIGVYYDDPREISWEECRSEACIPFEGKVKPKKEIRIKDLG